MKIADIPLVERPREKLLAKGAENLKIEELLAILFRSGRKGLSALDLGQSLVAQYDLPEIARLSAIDLQTLEGIDSSKACTLLAAIELGRRISLSKESGAVCVFTPGDAIPLLTSIRSQKKEHFVAMYLNARQEVLHQEVVSIGTLNASLVHPREVFEPALKHLASVVLLAHNHPSGNVEPSDADLSITKRLSDAGRLLGIEVMDHIIVAKDRYYSFREHGSL